MCYVAIPWCICFVNMSQFQKWSCGGDEYSIVFWGIYFVGSTSHFAIFSAFLLQLTFTSWVSSSCTGSEHSHYVHCSVCICNFILLNAFFPLIENPHANCASLTISCYHFNLVRCVLCIFFVFADHFKFAFDACMRDCMPFCEYNPIGFSSRLAVEFCVRRIHLVDCIWLYNAYEMLLMMIMMIHFNIRQRVKIPCVFAFYNFILEWWNICGSLPRSIPMLMPWY